MKRFVSILIILVSTGLLTAQNNEADALKKYDFYRIKHLESGKWQTKCSLKNGHVITEESYFKNELRSRRKYDYDQKNNRIREIRTFDINMGIIKDTIEIKIIYTQDSLITEKHTLGTIEKFSDFNALGKPRILERTEDFGFSSYKEFLEYDENGNVIKEVAYTKFKNPENNIVREKEINIYSYDSLNNVIEIKREFIPKKTFPIPITGGPSLNEIEKYRYVYNNNGLWIKKYKTINGVEKLVAKRILK